MEGEEESGEEREIRKGKRRRQWNRWASGRGKRDEEWKGRGRRGRGRGKGHGMDSCV